MVAESKSSGEEREREKEREKIRVPMNSIMTEALILRSYFVCLAVCS